MRTCLLCKTTVKHPLKHLRTDHTEIYDEHIANRSNFFVHFSKSTNHEVLRPEITRPTIWEANKMTIYFFIWEDIFFQNGGIQINIKRLSKKFELIKCENSLVCLNLIKEDIFFKKDGHKLYKLKALDSKIIINSSSDVVRILSLVESAIELYKFKHRKFKKLNLLSEAFLLKHSNEQILSFVNCDIEKAPYLKFLYRLQNSEFKLIPIREVIGNSKEDSLIFRFKDEKGKIIVVWENVNSGRATYMFKISKKEQLNNILSYICDNENYKRSYLKSAQNKNWSLETLGYIASFEHEELNVYEAHIINAAFKSQ